MVKKNNITAIIQARMGSTRLPGKVLMKIKGKPMVWHVVNRLRCCRLITDIVVATSTSRADDRLAAYLKKSGIDYCRGSENDVLDRYYKTAMHFQSDAVVRITADCPLIDPGITDLVIREYLKSKDKVKLASNTIRRSFPRGLDTEVFSFSALERAWKDADRPYQREHVTLYMYENPRLFKLKSVEHKPDLSYMRWTVDEKADFQFVTRVFSELYPRKNFFMMDDIIKLIEKDPGLYEINSKVEQKKVDEK